MRVLVAGGAGYIGSNMTAALLDNGHQPVVFDNLSRGHSQAIKDAEFVKGDLADEKLLIETLTKYKIDAVMHFAALIEVGESVTNPLGFYRNNVANTLTLLRAMETAKVEKFVFSSTAAVYGMPERVPITEDMPTIPINPYGQTKIAVEKMCHWQSKISKLRFAALRYFNACGAGKNGKIGEDHRPESHLIPLTIFAAMGKRSDIKIFGTDYETHDGTCVRDYIHVQDICSAHLLALDKLDQTQELICNLGNGKGYSVRQIIETVKQISGKDFNVIETDRRPGDPAVLTSDASRAKDILGWNPKFPNIENIVESAWKWHSENPNGYLE